MQPAAAPCMTGAVNFITMKLSMSACCMHAATSLNLQEWVCLLDGWTPWTSTPPPPTYAPWPQELNLFCETRFFCFSIQDELWGLSWPAASHQPSAKKTRKVCCILMYIILLIRVMIHSASKATNSRNSKLPRQPAKFHLSAVYWWPQVLRSPVSFATLGG